MIDADGANPEVSIVIPCLDESETVADCVRSAKEFLAKSGIEGEVIVSDNGSSDGSPELAEEAGAKVVFEPEKGYGSALRTGIEAAKGGFVIIGDSDGSHDLKNLDKFVERLRKGFDLVVGDRFAGGIEKGSMSALNRYVGNPFLTGIGKVFFKSKVKDFHCGLRGFTKKAYGKMKLRASGMEFASEMVVKATLLGMKIDNVPTPMFAPGRSGPPHLRSFRDGWRHLRFLLLFSPRWLFFYPGLAMIILGAAAGLWLLPGMRLSLDVHTMYYASIVIIIGFHSVSFAILSKIFAAQEGFLPENARLQRYLDFFTLEKGLILGGLLLALGIAGAIRALILLKQGGFPELGISRTMRVVIPSGTLTVIGFQLIFSAFFYNILKLKRI